MIKYAARIPPTVKVATEHFPDLFVDGALSKYELLQKRSNVQKKAKLSNDSAAPHILKACRAVIAAVNSFIWPYRVTKKELSVLSALCSAVTQLKDSS